MCRFAIRDVSEDDVREGDEINPPNMIADGFADIVGGESRLEGGAVRDWRLRR